MVCTFLRMNQIKPSTYQVGSTLQVNAAEISKTKIDFFFRLIINDTLSLQVSGNDEDKKPVTTVTSDYFNIATHSLKIKNSGAYIDIDETWSQHGMSVVMCFIYEYRIDFITDWVSPSSSKLMKTLKDKNSIERFNQASAPNEVINFLKYFSQPSPVDGKFKMSWGPVSALRYFPFDDFSFERFISVRYEKIR